MLGCYRKGDAENPDLYVAAIAAVLADYPPEIIKRSTDPRTGIAGHSKWLPAVAEVRAFCESEYAPVRREQERVRLAEERKRALPPPVEDRSKRPTIDELKSKYGPTWGIDVHDSDLARRAACLKEIEEANRRVFARECERDGIDPQSNVSPSLLKTLNSRG